MKEKRLAPGNPRLAITLHSFANLLRDEGKLPEAEAAYRRALDIRVHALGATNDDVRETSTALADDAPRRVDRYVKRTASPRCTRRTADDSA